jgi:hypothetical protein
MQESHAANMTNNLKGNQEQIPVSFLLSFSLDNQKKSTCHPRRWWMAIISYIYICTLYIHTLTIKNGTKQHTVLVVNAYPLVNDGTSIGIGMLISYINFLYNRQSSITPHWYWRIPVPHEEISNYPLSCDGLIHLILQFEGHNMLRDMTDNWFGSM